MEAALHGARAPTLPLRPRRGLLERCAGKKCAARSDGGATRSHSLSATATPTAAGLLAGGFRVHEPNEPDEA